VHCHGKAARSVLVKVGDDVFALFQVVSAKLRSLASWDKFFMHIPLMSKKVMSMLLRLLFTRLAFLGLGDMGLFHWEENITPNVQPSSTPRTTKISTATIQGTIEHGL